MTDCRMRTFGAGPVLACVIAIAVVLICVSVALGYRIAQSSGSSTVQHVTGSNAFDFKRPEGRVLIDRVGELAGRLTRLEIEAAELAQRVGVAPRANAAALSRTAAARAAPQQGHDAQPGISVAEASGGPWLPASPSSAAARHATGDYTMGLSHLEAGIALLETSLERMAGIVADRDLTGMAYPNRPPVPGNLPKISSGFGVRSDPFTGRLARHMGLDIPAAHGTPILASGGGRVRSAGVRGPYGKAIVIDHGDGLQTLYGHCSKLYVRQGDLVMPQQKIAAVGSTGRSTGPHLHFEVIRDGVRVEPGRVLASVLPPRTPN